MAVHNPFIGLQVRDKCDIIYNKLLSGDEKGADEMLFRECKIAKEHFADERLKASVFGLMQPADLKWCLMHKDNKLYHKILEMTEKVLAMLDDAPSCPHPVKMVPQDNVPECAARAIPMILDQTERVIDMFDKAPACPYPVKKMVPEKNVPQELASKVPMILDQTMREPATNTQFGHTAKTKYLTYKILQKMNLTRDVAVTGAEQSEHRRRKRIEMRNVAHVANRPRDLPRHGHRRSR